MVLRILLLGMVRPGKHSGFRMGDFRTGELDCSKENCVSMPTRVCEVSLPNCVDRTDKAKLLRSVCIYCATEAHFNSGAQVHMHCIYWTEWLPAF